MCSSYAVPPQQVVAPLTAATSPLINCKYITLPRRNPNNVPLHRNQYLLKLLEMEECLFEGDQRQKELEFMLRSPRAKHAWQIAENKDLYLPDGSCEKQKIKEALEAVAR